MICRKAQKLILFMIIGVASQAHAHDYYNMLINPREMGLGGSFISVVNDENSLWFNPAGIARDNGIHWTIANPYAGASNPTVIQNLQNLQNASKFQSTLNSLYDQPMWAGGGADTAIIMPHFAFGYYYATDASLLIDNPVDPTMNLNYLTDQGLAMGTGWSFGGILDMGLVAKYITRTGVAQSYGADTIANIINGSSQPSAIFNNLTNKGSGISLDWGTNINLPGPGSPTLSFVWNDIGNTSFKPASAGGIAPPTDYSDMEAGGSFHFDLPMVNIMPVFQVDEINDSTVQLTNKIHAGVELGLPFIDLQTGLYQGYFCYGAGFDLGLINIEAASWGEEMGGQPGQMESRRYLVQVTLRLGFDELGHLTSGASSESSSADDSGDSFFDTGENPYAKVRR